MTAKKWRKETFIKVKSGNLNPENLLKFMEDQRCNASLAWAIYGFGTPIINFGLSLIMLDRRFEYISPRNNEFICL